MNKKNGLTVLQFYNFTFFYSIDARYVTRAGLKFGMQLSEGFFNVSFSYII